MTVYDADFPPERTDGCVSVVVPTYHRPWKLAACLTALFNQSVECEIIVVHAGDSETEEVLDLFERVDECEFKRYALPDADASAARNKGIDGSTKEYVLFTDDDCVPPVRWAESFLWVFDRFDRVVTAGGTNWPHESVTQRVAAQADILRLRRNQVRDGLTVGGFELKTFGTSNVGFRRESIGDIRFESTEVLDDDAGFQRRVLDATGGHNAYIPMPTWHIRDYTVGQMVEQAISRGRNTYYVEGGRTLSGSALGLALSPLLLVTEVARDGKVGGVLWFRDMFVRYGMISEMIRELKR
jgi:glycosyltransferase involved in cell wall biosynthesis